MTSHKGIALLIIDPQKDFHEGGALAVEGATADSRLIARLIQTYQKQISAIHVTLDSHHPYDISHPCFWLDSNGNNPANFTRITFADVNDGTWQPVRSDLLSHCKLYCKHLDTQGRQIHTIWPGVMCCTVNIHTFLVQLLMQLM
jgi:nicotinamidase/pyrazinamidase